MSFNFFSKTGRKVLLAVPVALAAWQTTAANSWPLATANTAFAFDLMNQVAQAQPDANVFISPFSVSSALQMVNNGAVGDTKAEMQRVLKIDGMAADSLNPAFAALNQQLTTRQDVTVNLANGLWYQNEFHLKPVFAADNQKFFQAELAGVDFGKPEAAKTINDWADKQTKGKIKDVVQFPFPPLTRLILANAIYFKGQWVKEFKKNQTKWRFFHFANGKTRQTPMMTQDGHFSYQETPDFQAVTLPYKGRLQMELYLPQTNASPLKLLAGFATGGNWQKDVQMRFMDRDGSVTLPKFKIEYDVQLNKPLMALGMTSAFSGRADFSGIADEPTYISEVKQKSYVDVNEEGTEAAAVTTVGVRSSAMRMPSQPFTMVLDRPFFFVISDLTTGSILFMGIVNDPTAGG